MGKDGPPEDWTMHKYYQESWSSEDYLANPPQAPGTTDWDGLGFSSTLNGLSNCTMTLKAMLKFSSLRSHRD
eukprot:NODE_7705_length_425_cov_191.502703.p2 GENE.NODE_7705_length_425_cov_191.502703~~NODE_7705_length_425_cov_191.502703.p2  ORF type:complete len:82 (+),score=13.60 NODE_7705_length_425_cov_191.502703:32-247(+)